MSIKNEPKRRIKQKVIAFLKTPVRPRDFSSALGRDRYKSLKIRLFLIIGTLAGIPLFTLMVISFFWLQNILEEDFKNQLRWQIESTQQSMEFFLKEKLSGLRFLASVHSYSQLSNQNILNDIFVKRQREFSELVDLGVMKSDGIQKSYVGPYHLEGKDYSNQDWFYEVIIRGTYVSDVFMGYRKLPHFTIAVRKEVPEKGTFWILRATIDMETLNRFVSTINLKENDDAFIINHQGILQTPSRFHGNVLERLKLKVFLPRKGISLMDMKDVDGSSVVFGYVHIKDSPWILGVIMKSSIYTKIIEIFQSELLIIFVITIIIGIIVNLRTSQKVVNRIKEADQRREEAIAETEHAGKLASIGRLAAGVAHEINNPLAIINEKAGLMKDILEMSGDLQNKERFLTLINSIFDSVNRCRTITHRLLGFASRMEVSREVLDLNDTIKEVIGFLEKETLFRNIHLELDLKEYFPKIDSDKGQLQQVFLNIINNAIDTVKDGGLIEVSTKVKDENTVRISIRDNGPGIPKNVLKHIFEPFFTTKEKGEGTGLGLFISYGIMQRLGGTILVESEVNKGTTFTVEIPIKAKS